jgi:crossover junction endodeoxyribonuclease RusA
MRRRAPLPVGWAAVDLLPRLLLALARPSPRGLVVAAACGGGPVTAAIVYELDLPWTAPPLNLNHKHRWYVHVKKVREVREAACVLAKAARIGPHRKVRVTLHYRPRDRRTRDVENPTPTLKACCDGIVDAGVVPDDAPEFMVKDMPVLHEAASVSGLKPRLWLVVEPLWDEVPP